MNLASQGQRLLDEMSADPYGDFSPSLYETARIVALAPTLAGHGGRIRYLLDEQHDDGSWGAPYDYALLPTLSATEALLSESRRTRSPAVAAAARDGLRALFLRLAPGRAVTLPDTVAVEILVPHLVAEINAHLAALEDNPLPGLEISPAGARLPCPPGTYPELLGHLRETVARGQVLPEKLWHSLEVVGPAARRAPFASPGEFGLGCSPAATAAWFGAVPAQRQAGVRYLEVLQARHGGPVPVAAPLDVFERAWVLATFTDVGLPVSVPAGLVDGLRAACGSSGVAGGAGLPPDADDTSTALHALANLGVPQPIDALWEFQADDHFSTYPEERTPSVSTNAHVLQAFIAHPERTARIERAMVRLVSWLCGQQQADGSWTDKWHASPYYATVCCVVALAGCGEPTPAIRQALHWVLDNQREDGSWGYWESTPEETAYAVQILLRGSAGRPDPAIEHAAARGCAHLLGGDLARTPPLWHDKDLYTPARIVRAETIAALHLARANPRVAALTGRWETGQPERTA
ncbi:prenyltransferase/squalene oxidase repeat-containing protein [Amycolatopsis cynarae]